MSMSSSEVGSFESPVPVTSFSYRDMGAAASFQVKETRQAGSGAEQEREQQAAPGISAQEIEDLLNLARAEAVAETEARLKTEYEARSKAEAEKIRQALELFLGGTQGLFFPG